MGRGLLGCGWAFHDAFHFEVLIVLHLVLDESFDETHPLLRVVGSEVMDQPLEAGVFILYPGLLR